MATYRVVAPDFVAAVSTKYGVVIARETAPILRYMHRWTVPRFLNYCRSKGWTVETLPQREPVCD